MRYAEWCTAAPSLEADIAAAAMGLDDLGHSRVLYGCLGELGEPAQNGDGVYANLPYLDQPWTAWSQFVAANTVLDSAFTLTIEALAGGTVEVLKTRLRKMLQEERYHFLHGRSWARERKDEVAMADAWQQAVEWWGPEEDDIDKLRHAGVLSLGTSDLRNRLAALLETPAPEMAIRWQSWDPVRRRTRPGGIDPTTLEMIQGLAEKRYMPSSSRAESPSA